MQFRRELDRRKKFEVRKKSPVTQVGSASPRQQCSGYGLSVDGHGLFLTSDLYIQL